MSGSVNPRNKKVPGRTSRYYRCAVYRPQYHLIKLTGGCPRPHCLKEACPNYMGTLPRGRPSKLLTDKEIGERHVKRIIESRERMREFRAAFTPDKGTRELNLPTRQSHVLETNFRPAPDSKYYHCARFRERPFICPIPKRLCSGCEHYIAKIKRKGGQKDRGIVNWDSEKERREHRAEYMRAYRKGRKRPVTM